MREARVILFLFFPCRCPLCSYPLITEGVEQPGCCGKSPWHHHFAETATSIPYNGLGKDGSSLRPRSQVLHGTTGKRDPASALAMQQALVRGSCGELRSKPRPRQAFPARCGF